MWFSLIERYNENGEGKINEKKSTQGQTMVKLQKPKRFFSAMGLKKRLFRLTTDFSKITTEVRIQCKVFKVSKKSSYQFRFLKFYNQVISSKTGS